MKGVLLKWEGGVVLSGGQAVIIVLSVSRPIAGAQLAGPGCLMFSVVACGGWVVGERGVGGHITVQC
jgi:hypothetical protein